MKARVKEIVANRWLISALRVILGGIFITASVGKLQHPAEFTNAVISYGILPNGLAQFYGFMLPWVELFIGCSLVLGIFSRFASVISIPLIVSFVTASAYSLFNPVEGSCGCFGQLIPVSHSVSLVIDAVMLSMAGQLLLHKDKAEFLSIGSLLCRCNLGLERRGRFIFEKASKFAIVALAMVVVISFVGGAQGSLDTESDSTTEFGKPVFLFFYKGSPCAPRNQCEIIDDLEQEYADKIVFMRINYEEYPQAVEDFDIKDSPTMVLLTSTHNKEQYAVYQRFEGTVDKEMLKDSFEQVLRNREPDGEFESPQGN